MSDLSRDDEIALAEYREAVTQCRWCDQMTRTSLALFVPFATALVGIIETEKVGQNSAFALSFFGLVISVLIFNSQFRLRAYYACYLTTAKDREGQLGMKLYTKAGSDIERLKINIPTKAAFYVIAVLFSIYFLVALYRYWPC